MGIVGSRRGERVGEERRQKKMREIGGRGEEIIVKNG